MLGITKKQLANAPTFKPSDVPEFSTSYRRDLAGLYGRSGGKVSRTRKGRRRALSAVQASGALRRSACRDQVDRREVAL